MDIPVRRGNIFTLLEDDEGEEVQAPKSKQTKAQPVPASQPKTEQKSAKTKPPAKKSEAVADAPQTQGKEQRKPKFEDKPERDDRKSKTGRGREMKKGGGGRHNWGKPEDDAKPEPEVPWTGESKKEGEAVATEEPKEEAQEPAEKAPDFITFSDFVNPKDEEDGKEKEEDDVKGHLNFKVSFGNRPERRGRGRGGRRGGRDGGAGETHQDSEKRPARGPRPAKKDDQVSAPNPLDLQAFPSLA